MRTRTGYSTDKTASVAVEQALSGITNPKCLLFASAAGIFDEVGSILSERFPDCVVCGVSTAITLSQNNDWTNNPMGIGLSITEFGDDFDCVAGLLDYTDPKEALKTVSECVGKIKDYRNTICLEFVAAMPMDEEIVLELLSTGLEGTGIPVVGACGSTDTPTKMSKIYYKNMTYSRSCVFILLHNKLGAIRMYKENLYRTTRHALLATDVDLIDRMVYKFDDIPAAEAIARELNMETSEFVQNPSVCTLGRNYNNELAVIDIDRVFDDGSIRTRACVYGGTRSYILEPEDYRDSVKRVIDKIRHESSKCRFIFIIAGYTMVTRLRSENYMNEYTSQFNSTGVEYAGITAFGEQYKNYNSNKSFIYIVFDTEVENGEKTDRNNPDK